MGVLAGGSAPSAPTGSSSPPLPPLSAASETICPALISSRKVSTAGVAPSFSKSVLIRGVFGPHKKKYFGISLDDLPTCALDPGHIQDMDMFLVDP